MRERSPPGGELRLTVAGEKDSGKAFRKTVILPLGDAGNGAERLAAAGIETREEGGRLLIDNVVFGSAAEKAGLDFDQEIVNLQIPTERPPKQWLFIPAIALVWLVAWLQRRRRDALKVPAATA